MASATLDQTCAALNVDPALHKAMLDAVNNCLVMCGLSAKCVGMCTVPASEGGDVTGMIGVHGKVSGFVTVNMSQRLAVRAVEGLLQEKFGALSTQVVDGLGEITNIIVGGMKSALSSTPKAFPHITVPSVIVGSGYSIAYARGLEFLCGIFEVQDEEALMLADRLLPVNVSLLRL